MDKRRRAEWKAGLFVNFGLALAMLGLFLFRTHLSPFSHPEHYTFLVPDAQGLIVGTKVMVAGLAAGQVDHLSLDERTREVRVDLDVNPRFRRAIRQDSVVELATQGVLGDKQVLISPGSPDRPAVPPGEPLPVRASTDLNQILGRGSGLVQDIDHLVVGLDDLLKGLGGRGQSKKITRDAAQTLSNVAELSGKINSAINSSELAGSLTELHGILSKVNRGQGTLGGLVNDPGPFDDLKALFGEVNRNRILHNLARKTLQDKRAEEAQQAGKGQDKDDQMAH